MKHYCNEFILTNLDQHFVLKCNGNIIQEKQFKSISEAERYFQNHITSYVNAYLTLKTSEIRKVKFGR